MTYEEFRTERTNIISRMLDNSDKYGIYPSSICFDELDKVYKKVVEDEREACVRIPLKKTRQRMKYNPKNQKHVEKMLEITINAYPDQRVFLRMVKNIALTNHWELTYQEKMYHLEKQ